MSEQTGSTGPRPEQTFFDAPAIDRLMGVVMSLATEVYVLRDRLGALEAELDDKGIVSRDALGAEPSDAQRAQSVADRDAFVEHLLSNLLGQQQSKGALR